MEYTEELYPVYRNKKMGYVNREGKVVIPLKFEMADFFTGNLARVREEGKFGFIDRAGNYVIPPVYNDAKNFSEGLAAVHKDIYWGFVNEEGELVIMPQFIDVTSFKNGIAGFTMDDTYWGLINKTGEIIVEPDFWEIELDENDPLYKKYGIHKLPSIFSYNEEGMYHYIDKEGRVFPGDDYHAADKFSDGLAAVCHKKTEKWGYMDPTGKIVIPPQFDRAFEFHEGVAVIEDDGKYGYVDKAGRIVMQPQFDWAESMQEGLAVIKKDGKYGYMDKTGKIVIPPKYISADGFSGGVAIVKMETENGEKQGVIDKTGKWLFDLDYKILRSDYSKPFENGTAVIYTSNYKYGIINKTGKVLFPPKFDKVTDFHGDLAAVQKGGKWGFINKKGEYVKKPAYDEFKFWNKDRIWVKKNEKWGLMDPSGKYIKKTQFKRIYPFELMKLSEDKHIVFKNGAGIMDVNGNYILTPKYSLNIQIFLPYLYNWKLYNNQNTFIKRYPFWHFMDKNKEYIVNRQGETVAVVDWEKQEAQS